MLRTAGYDGLRPRRRPCKALTVDCFDLGRGLPSPWCVDLCSRFTTPTKVVQLLLSEALDPDAAVLGRASQDPAGGPFRAAQRATALAPMISKRRSVRSPILDVRPSRSLPPLER